MICAAISLARSRGFAALAVMGALFLAGADPTHAEEPYPSKVIKLIAPFAAGGGTDVFARRFLPQIGGGIGSKVIIENKPGANSIVATQAVVQAPPDGYTLLLQTNSLIVNPFLLKELPYDTFQDLAPVSLVARTPHVLVVSNSLPVKSVRQLVDYGKAHPDTLNYGSGGIGSTNHLAGAVFAKLAGIKMEHVAYKGASEYMRDLTPGTISLVFAGADQAVTLAKSGKVRALATTGANRLPDLPDVPTMAEAGFPLEMYSWTGFFAPAKTPQPIIDQLSRDMRAAAQSPQVRKQFSTYELIGSTPEQFADFLNTQTAQVGGLLSELGLAVSKPRKPN